MATAARAEEVAFQVIDETDPAEISEDTVIFVNGLQVAHFVLDRGHAASIADIRVPKADHYDYALCGRITIALPDGKSEQHVVDGGATLLAPDGHIYRALAANNFTIFYLADATKDSPDLPRDLHHTNACALAVS